MNTTYKNALIEIILSDDREQQYILYIDGLCCSNVNTAGMSEDNVIKIAQAIIDKNINSKKTKKEIQLEIINLIEESEEFKNGNVRYNIMLDYIDIESNRQNKNSFDSDFTRLFYFYKTDIINNSHQKYVTFRVYTKYENHPI